MTVSIQSFVAQGETTTVALQSLAAKLASNKPAPSLIFLFYDCMHDAQAIYGLIQNHFPGVPLLGGSSCRGIMSEAGLADNGAIGMLIIEDTQGEYGAAGVRLDDDATACARKALYAALSNAGCEGELPELIWIYQAPGQEEAVMDGLRSVVGDRCPIVGGSSADNDVAGNWSLIGPEGPVYDGLIVAVLFSSGGIGYAFQSGYEPSGLRGIVTRVEGLEASSSGVVTATAGRSIMTIDGEPAATVYDRWTAGILGEKVKGGNILEDTTMFPLGIDHGRIGDVPQYRLIHPSRITAEGAITTFAAVSTGTQIHAMTGQKSHLVDRAGKVAAAAAAMLPQMAHSPAGGLIVYCAGCMIAVDEQMPKVSDAVTTSLADTPFLGCFTYGEQGHLLGENTHGNLMISAIVFGR